MSLYQIRGLAVGVAASVLSTAASANLIISEYVEGSGYNKALEISNTSSDTVVDLNDYQLKLFSNGNLTATSTQALSGTLPPGATYVLVNSQTAEPLAGLADQTSAVVNFNGNDVVQLLNSSGTVLDTIGTPGSDSNFAKDMTLARKADITQPSAIYQPEQWNILGKDYFAGIGTAPGGTGDGNGGDSGGDSGDNTQPPLLAECGAPSSRISALQGAGAATPVAGETHSVQAIVSRVLYNSYYIQQSLAAEDITGASRGILVYDPVNQPSVGDEVVIQGKVSEYQSVTQLSDVNEQFKVCTTGNSLTPEVVYMPVDGNFEAYEGMLVDLLPRSGDSEFFVTDTYQLNRFADLVVSSGQPLAKPTNLYPAGSDEAQALQADNDANRIVVGDGDNRSYRPAISYLPNLSFDEPARIGSVVTFGMQGVITEGFGDYRLLPTGELLLDNPYQPRMDYPEPVEGKQLRLVSFNVLNYFNGTPTELDTVDWLKTELGAARGANSAEEFARQRQKITTALNRINADIIGLVEIENDGWGENSAIYDLVQGLNNSEEINPGVEYAYSLTEQPFVGQDVIKVGVVYNQNRVRPVGLAKVILDYPFDETTAKHRPPVVQTFRDQFSGNNITVVVNHFKSKGSGCDALNDRENVLGQGNCNRLRVAAAETLGRYLQENHADEHVVILGDLNAYAQEDPLLVLTNNVSARAIETISRSDEGEYIATPIDFNLGYSNSLMLNENSHQSNHASYVFAGESGTLDYVLVSNSLKERVKKSFIWSINAFELAGMDYNDEFYRSYDGLTVDMKNNDERQWFDKLVDSASPLRSSDHDPVIVDVDMSGSLGIPLLMLGFMSLYLRRRSS